MKNFNRAGGELSCRQYDKVTLFPSYEELFNPAKDEYKDRSLLAWGHYLCRSLSIGIFLLFINLAIQPAYRQETLKVKPLQIGDTIPEVLWDMSFEVINHPQGKSVMTLSEYRKNKKLIILDFWATWCKSCIEGFPKLDQLQLKFGDDLGFILINSAQTKDTKSKLHDFLAEYKQEDDYQLTRFSIINDKVFQRMFPHVGIPHYIWIDSNNVVIANTHPNEVNYKNIQAALHGNSIEIHQKKENVEDVLLAQEFNRNQNLIRRSTLSGYKEGFRFDTGSYYREDSLYLYQIANQSLIYLCLKAFGSQLLDIDVNRWVFDTKLSPDVRRQLIQPISYDKYCFEIVQNRSIIMLFFLPKTKQN